MAEHKVRIGGQLLYTGIPWGITIPSHHGNTIPDHGSAPSGCGIKRYIKSDFLCHPLQRPHMLLTFFSGKAAHVSVFILDLQSDHRTSVFIKKAFDLLIKLLPVTLYIMQIPRVITPQLNTFFLL